MTIPKHNTTLFHTHLRARLRWGQVTPKDIHAAFQLSVENPIDADDFDELLPVLIDQLVDDGWRVER